MNIKDIYELAIKEGKKADFRGEKGINWKLSRTKKEYENLSEEKKEFFDEERLNNPYSDTRILHGDPETEVKKILVGIDIDGEELLLAKEMEDIDLVISHHPRGQALAGLDDVMDLQIDMLNHYGVPINIAEKLLKKRIKEVSRGLSPGNHQRAVDMARLLDIPLMSIHTPCDNLVAKFVEEKLEKDNPRLLKDVLESLLEIPEYREAEKLGVGPKLFVGSKKNRSGKIVLTEITGGTEGSPEIYEKLADAGAGTIIGMHISEKHRKEAQKAHINVVIAGHMSSDSIGVNLFLDKLEDVEIIPCSGFIRNKRNK
ncbi:MAG: NGG1p interacting factor NIF3 [Patescibacteria group bacterium]